MGRTCTRDSRSGAGGGAGGVRRARLRGHDALRDRGRVGVSPAALLRHAPTKRDLFVAAWARPSPRRCRSRSSRSSTAPRTRGRAAPGRGVDGSVSRVEDPRGRRALGLLQARAGRRADASALRSEDPPDAAAEEPPVPRELLAPRGAARTAAPPRPERRRARVSGHGPFLRVPPARHEVLEKPMPLGDYLDTVLDIWTRGAIVTREDAMRHGTPAPRISASRPARPPAARRTPGRPPERPDRGADRRPRAQGHRARRRGAGQGGRSRQGRRRPRPPRSRRDGASRSTATARASSAAGPVHDLEAGTRRRRSWPPRRTWPTRRRARSREAGARAPAVPAREEGRHAARRGRATTEREQRRGEPQGERRAPHARRGGLPPVADGAGAARRRPRADRAEQSETVAREAELRAPADAVVVHRFAEPGLLVRPASRR